MTSSTVFLTAAILFIGSFQLMGVTAAVDPDYYAFEMNILYEVQEAEYKLNSSWETYVNNVQTFNLPEFSEINSTIIGYWENLQKEYPSADPTCVTYITQDVLQTIADSKLELEACTNLTHSWNLIGQLIQQAKDAVNNLDNAVNEILTKALRCVTIKNPNVKKSCFNSAFNFYSSDFNKGISLAQEAYSQIAGGNLLLGVDVSSCQNAEKQSFNDKFSAIREEFLGNCLPSTTAQPA